MRTCGPTIGAGGFGAHDHVCWSFAGPNDLVPAVVDFLAEGLRLGLRAEFIAAWPRDAALLALAPLGDVDALVDRGDLRVTAVVDFYGVATEAIADPQIQVRAYTAATVQALNDGYQGLRVAADATTIVDTPARQEAFARYEHLVDAAMVTMPFSALCAYDRDVLGADAVAEMAALHPVARAGAAPFGVFHGPLGLAARGEIDSFDTALLAQTLTRSMPLAFGDNIELDAAELSFVDHRALLTLEDHGRAAGATITLRHATPSLARLDGLMDLRAVRFAAGDDA